MGTSRLLAGVFLVVLSIPLFADEPVYDLVIRNGRVVDGTGNPWFHGDVAIKGDRIAAVRHVPPGSAKREIDAKGLVVAPGFIDMHSHSDRPLLEDGHAQSKIRQGVTTEVLGEGGSAGPSKGQLPPASANVRGTEKTWTTLGGYFSTLEEAGTSVNVASYVGINSVWQSVMGRSFDRPTPAQFDEMKVLIDEAMREGAFGLSTMLAMPPGSLATTDDLVELTKVVARHGGIYSTHNRNEGTGVFEAVQEAITIGEKAGVTVDIIHLKIADQKLWHRMPEVVALIEAARQRGVDVQANVYPYIRGNNNLSSIIPPWAHEGGRSKLIERLKNGDDRERMKRDIKEGIEGWYNHYTAVGGDWSRMLVSGKGPYEGLTMDRVLAIRNEGKSPAPGPLDSLFDLLIEMEGSVPTVYAHHTEEDMNLALSQPWCSIGSDGSAYSIEGPLRRGNPHPRNFGTFPRVLGVYVREAKLLKLEDAVRKMTSLNAARLGIADRGVLRPGAFADITVFDSDRVIDKATYTAPFAYPEGIELVIVNGQVVLEGSQHTGRMPGRVLRHVSRPEGNPPADTGAPAAQWTSLFDGQSLEGWKVTQFGGNGQVEVEDGAIRLNLGDGCTGITIDREFPTMNYEVSLKAMRVEGIDFFCGMTFPVGESPCSFIVGGWGGPIVGLSSIDGEDAARNETTKRMKFKVGQWYTIRLKVTPERIEAWIDEEQVVDFATAGRKLSIRPEVALSKPFGICSWNTTAALKDIKVRSLK